MLLTLRYRASLRRTAAPSVLRQLAAAVSLHTHARVRSNRRWTSKPSSPLSLSSLSLGHLDAAFSTASNTKAYPAPSVTTTTDGALPRTALSLVPQPSTRAVMAAIAGNTCVFVGKAIAAMGTGSGVMLAEAFHSLADTANQILLMVGIMRSERPASVSYPYGFAPLKPAFALISATGFFFLGCGFSVAHGVSSLMDPQPIEHFSLAAGVLFGSFIVEGATLVYAVRAVKEMLVKRNKSRGDSMNVLQYIQRGRDTSLVAVVLEDGAAVAGLGIAAASLCASYITGNPMYDALGTITVGLGLGAVAVFLIKRNLSVLAGQAVPSSQEKSVVELLLSMPTIKSVNNVKTVTWGGNTGRFKADVSYSGRAILQDLMNQKCAESGAVMREVWLRKLKDARTDEEKMELMYLLSDELMDELGCEVDRMEDRIRSIKDLDIEHIDLESHAPAGRCKDHDRDKERK